MLDLDRDPAPGEPLTVQRLSRSWDAFADDVETAEHGVRSLASDGAVLAWIGAAGEAFRPAIAQFPDDLGKCKDSYRQGARALAVWAGDLVAAQDQADRALALGRVARAELHSAQGALAAATGSAGAADREAQRMQDLASRYADQPASSSSSAPDPDAVRAAVRTAQAAQARVAAARSQVADAQSRLDAARRMALDAQAVREERGRVAAKAIDAASDAGIQNRSFWDNVKEVAGKVWDAVIVVAKVVVVVLGVIALVIGGPLAWVVLGAALLLLADALYKYSQGEATWGDVAWAMVGCIPGTRGLTTLKALTTAFRTGGVLGAGAHVLSAGRTALVGMAAAVRGAAGRAGSVLGGLPNAVRNVRVLTAQTPDGMRVPAGIDLSSLRTLMSGVSDGAGVARPHESAPVRSLKPTHEISGDRSSKTVRDLRNDMRQGTFDWERSPVSVVRHEGETYVVDGHHRLAAARLAGLDEIVVRDVTEELTSRGFLGYRDMADVLQGAQGYIGNRLNPYKLR